MRNSILTHLSLCSGIGGFDLAAEWAGFTTIAFVEIDPYCQKVLKKHWPDTPIIGDIRDVTRKQVYSYAEQLSSRSAYREGSHTGRTDDRKDIGSRMGNDTGDLRQNRISGSRRRSVSPITLITGGIPCQPASVAGKRKGTADDRWLWPEAIRVLSTIKPIWAVFENPPGLLTLEGGLVFENLLAQMESKGYETTSVIIPAAGVNAPHKRERLFILANSRYHDRITMEITGGDGQTSIYCQERPDGRRESPGPDSNQGGDQKMADSNSFLRGRTGQEQCQGNGEEVRGCGIERLGGEYWSVEPNVGRVAHGIPSRLDRCRVLGNAVVPELAYRILKPIADWEVSNGRMVT